MTSIGGHECQVTGFMPGIEMNHISQSRIPSRMAYILGLGTRAFSPGDKLPFLRVEITVLETCQVISPTTPALEGGMEARDEMQKSEEWVAQYLKTQNWRVEKKLKEKPLQIYFLLYTNMSLKEGMTSAVFKIFVTY